MPSAAAVIEYCATWDSVPDQSLVGGIIEKHFHLQSITTNSCIIHEAHFPISAIN